MPKRGYKKVRKFGGETFYFEKSAFTKTNAKLRADSLRVNGGKARIVKYKDYYLIYGKK